MTDRSTAPTLVVLAAGFGTRFGGLKQLAPVGPAGEALLDYTIADAIAAGVEQVVVVVRPGIEDLVADHLAVFHAPGTIRLAVQPQPGGRPTGTAHAVAIGAASVAGPIVVANADDAYGPGALGEVVAVVRRGVPGIGALAGYRLADTVPPAGSVSRAVCVVGEDGMLCSIVEHLSIERTADGGFVSERGRLDADMLVSMNLWGLPADAVAAFVARAAGEPAARSVAEPFDPGDREARLPTVIGSLLAAGALAVEVVAAADEWAGLTNPADLEPVRAAIARRVDGGRLRS